MNFARSIILVVFVFLILAGCVSQKSTTLVKSAMAIKPSESELPHGWRIESEDLINPVTRFSIGIKKNDENLTGIVSVYVQESTEKAKKVYGQQSDLIVENADCIVSEYKETVTVLNATVSISSIDCIKDNVNLVVYILASSENVFFDSEKIKEYKIELAKMVLRKF